MTVESGDGRPPPKRCGPPNGTGSSWARCHRCRHNNLDRRTRHKHRSRPGRHRGRGHHRWRQPCRLGRHQRGREERATRIRAQIEHRSWTGEIIAQPSFIACGTAVQADACPSRERRALSPGLDPIAPVSGLTPVQSIDAVCTRPSKLAIRFSFAPATAIHRFGQPVQQPRHEVNPIRMQTVRQLQKLHDIQPPLLALVLGHERLRPVQTLRQRRLRHARLNAGLDQKSA